MTPTLEALGIDQMSMDERIALAQEILDSVVAERPTPALSDAKRSELQSRVAAYESNPGDVVPWETIEQAALARFAK